MSAKCIYFHMHACMPQYTGNVMLDDYSPEAEEHVTTLGGGGGGGGGRYKMDCGQVLGIPCT